MLAFLPVSQPIDIVSLDDIRAAAARLRGVTRVTPLLDAGELTSWAQPATVPLRLKCENLQVGGAFKIRGAFNASAQLPADRLAGGLLTYSSGNHGLAIALTARRLGVPAVIVMPTTAPAVKVEGARALGAEVVFEGTTTVQRRARAEAEAGARGMTIVPPFDDDRIVAGQGTIGLEILEQCPDVAAVYVQMSGGGLIAGVAAAVKQARPSVRVIGVEPAGAARMTASLAAGHPVTIESIDSIADGLLAVRPGEIPFRHIQAFVDRVVTITDAETVDAMRWLFTHAHIVAEPSGAITVAAVHAEARRCTDARAEPPWAGGAVVAVVSGGNVERSAFLRYLG